MKFVSWSMVCCLAVLSSACGSKSQQGDCQSLPPPVQKAMSDYRLAYAQAGTEGASPFRTRQTFSMNDAAARSGLDLTIFDAENLADTQAAQVQSMIDSGYDAIFISPVDTTTLATQIKAARQACIPVFLLDSDMDQSRVTAGTDYVTFVGQDPVQQGNMLANWLLTNVQGALTILELTGVDSAFATKGREQGFDGVMAGQPRASIVSRVAGNWRRPQARAAVQQAFASNLTINVVFAHNDAMGQGAVDALTDPANSGVLNGRVLGDSISLVSVDGTLEVVQQIAGGAYNATVDTQPDMGTAALAAWQEYLSGAEVPAWTPLPMTLIDATNATADETSAY